MPGSRHDRLVRLAKIALPSAVGVLIAFLALAPLDKSGDVSFILDKNKVDNAPERMRVEAARYVGEDNRGPDVPDRRQPGAPAQLRRAGRRHRRNARRGFGLAQGPVTLAANQRPLRHRRAEGRVTGRCAWPGPTATGSDPRRHRRPEGRDTMTSAGAGHRPDAARISSRRGGFSADLGERTGRARRRRSLENRAGGGQMRTMRRPASSLHRLPCGAVGGSSGACPGAASRFRR